MCISGNFQRNMGVELGICHQGPSMENAHLAEGYDYISILTSKINAALVRRFRELGVKMISTRTIGYDHIDLDAARACGMKVSNVTYSPECGRLYDAFNPDVHSKNETDSAAGRAQRLFTAGNPGRRTA